MEELDINDDQKFNPKRLILYAITIVCVVFSIYKISTYVREGEDKELDIIENIVEPEYLYGICIDSLNVIDHEVGNGETLSVMLDRYGISQAKVNEIVATGDGKFDSRAIKAGNKYVVMTTTDSLHTIQYFVYEKSIIDYVVFDLKDQISVTEGRKAVDSVRMQKSASIESSLWNAMINEGLNPALAMDLSDVYQWSIDFYGIQKGDAFNVVYEELFVEGESYGIGTIHGAWFEHGGRKHYAIRHKYIDAKGNEEVGYWDEEGKSLKSMFLKAPLKYSRISSRFSYARKHPVLRIVRPHLGVDYAAPAGTPVQAIGDGVVIARAYAGGNGNYIKIKHAQNFTSGYLHLRGFAKGIVVGSRVKQGQLIGYVGSTGISTGPHLDFRLWQAGKALDPLKLTNIKRDDLASQYKADFFKQRDRIVAELEGEEYVETIVDTTELKAKK